MTADHLGVIYPALLAFALFLVAVGGKRPSRRLLRGLETLLNPNRRVVMFLGLSLFLVFLLLVTQR